MAEGIAIKDTQHLSSINGNEKLPISDGSGTPKHVTIDDIRSSSTFDGTITDLSFVNADKETVGMMAVDEDNITFDADYSLSFTAQESINFQANEEVYFHSKGGVNMIGETEIILRTPSLVWVDEKDKSHSISDLFKEIATLKTRIEALENGTPSTPEEPDDDEPTYDPSSVVGSVGSGNTIAISNDLGSVELYYLDANDNKITNYDKIGEL